MPTWETVDLDALAWARVMRGAVGPLRTWGEACAEIALAINRSELRARKRMGKPLETVSAFLVVS